MEKKPITESALVRRINRKLTKDGTVIRKSRPRWESSVGTFYELNVDRNVVVSQHLDYTTLVKWGRDLGALRSTEFLEGLPEN